MQRKILYNYILHFYNESKKVHLTSPFHKGKKIEKYFLRRIQMYPFEELFLFFSIAEYRCITAGILQLIIS